MHILQMKAKKSQANGSCYPEAATYDFEAGAWINEEGMVAFQEGSELATKKNDIETGEDQKGE